VQAPKPSQRLLRLPLALAVGAALLGAALALAACGGSSSPGIASVGATKSTSSQGSSQGGSFDLGGPAAGGAGKPRGVHSEFAIAGVSRQNGLKFAACMRANGVPNFPDPGANGAFQASGIDPGSSGFQTAQGKCRQYMPNRGQPPSPAEQAQMQAHALAFSRCMRAHGVPGFPDPQFSTGRISIHITPGSGLDPGSPIFQNAQKACQSILPNLGGKVTAHVGP
jgi:hypothetical protein